MIKKIPILIICLISTSTAAQSLKDTVMLPVVIVSTKRQLTERALYINSIDSIVLVNSVQSDLSDLLQKNSSIYIKSYGIGGLATASFRGTSASHTLVLWNGLNINSPLWGSADLSLLPTFFSDEVSIYYGSSSIIKSSGGLGGCISLNNTPHWNLGTQVTLAQTLGSFGYNLLQLKVGFSSKKFISNTRLFHEQSENDFRYFDNATGRFDYTRQENADYKKDGALQEFYFKLNNRQFAGIKLMSMWSDRNLPPIMSFKGANRYENQKDNILNLIGEWKYYGSKTNWAFNSGFSRNSLRYILSNTVPDSTWTIYNTEALSHVFSNNLNFQYNFSDKTIIKSSLEAIYTRASYFDLIENTGFDVNRNDFKLNSSLHHVFSQFFSAYALAQQKLLNGELMPFIAAAGFECQIDKALTLRTNLGRNFHVPNLDDMYFTPGGNPNLKPEDGYQADAGLQYNGIINDMNFQLDVTGYAGWINNWILWRPSEFRYWTADNVKHVFTRGTELNLNLKGDLGILKYNLKGNYGFTRTTDEEKESESLGKQLIYIPKHVGNIQLFLEREAYSASISFHKTGSRFATTIEEKPISPYFFMDLGIGKIFKIQQHSLGLNFRVNNVLNKQYQIIQFRAMPGRNFSLSINLKLSSKA